MIVIESKAEIPGKWQIDFIGTSSGILTLVLGAWQIAGAVEAKRNDEKEYSDSLNSSLDSSGTFNSAIEREAIKNLVALNTYRKNLDTEAIISDIGKLMKTGNFASSEEAMNFSILMRKFLNEKAGNKSVERINDTMTQLIDIMNVDGDVSEVLSDDISKIINSHFGNDADKGLLESDILTFLKHKKSEIEDDFKNIKFAPGVTEKLYKKQDDFLNRRVSSDFSGSLSKEESYLWYGFDGFELNDNSAIKFYYNDKGEPIIKVGGYEYSLDDEEFFYNYDILLDRQIKIARKKIIDNFNDSEDEIKNTIKPNRTAEDFSNMLNWFGEKITYNILSSRENGNLQEKYLNKTTYEVKPEYDISLMAENIKNIMEAYDNMKLEIFYQLTYPDSQFHKFIFPGPIMMKNYEVEMKSIAGENASYSIMQQSIANIVGGISSDLFSVESGKIFDPIKAEADANNEELLIAMSNLIETKVAAKLNETKQKIIDSLREDYQKYGVASEGNIVGNLVKGVKDTTRILPSVRPHFG